MKIEQDTVVTLQYKLSDVQGSLIEESREPMVYLHGGYGNTLPKIEEALQGQAAGYQVTIQVEPEDAFGEYDSDLVKIEPRDALPDALEIGMQFEGAPEDDGDDEDQVRVFTVTDIADGKVVLDGNHPLAGIALRFSLNVTSVRAASDEEIAHRHVHGAHGHHHDDEDDEDGSDQYRSLPLQ
ncbi:MAG: peptidylprolyl isomerase [Burkholderiaceae bacterium]|jgi:FKBP-type peptidyl-prolyl cis-trans isomerase SlyD